MDRYYSLASLSSDEVRNPYVFFRQTSQIEPLGISPPQITSVQFPHNSECFTTAPLRSRATTKGDKADTSPSPRVIDLNPSPSGDRSGSHNDSVSKKNPASPDTAL